MKDQTKIQPDYDEKAGVLVAINGIIQTNDPLPIRLAAIQEVIGVYTERILQSQRESLVEKMEGMRTYTNPINKDSRLIDKSEIVSLINQNN